MRVDPARLRSYAFCAFFLAATPFTAFADDVGGSPVLNSLLSDYPQDTKKDVPRVPEPSGPPTPSQRLSLGINYTGFQVRWRQRPRWATEFRMQFGDANSNYGEVHAQVFGVREYRFFGQDHGQRITWYYGGEADYAKAEADHSSYKTKGFAAGGFGGCDFRISKRLFVGIDIGPYVISLKESATGISQTNLDFVANTSLNVLIF